MLTLRGKMSSYAPDVYRAKLHYYSNISLTGTPSVTDAWSGNSAYDPYNTGVGSQPMGFDQLMNIYDRYRVRASKIIVSTANTNSSLPESISVWPSLSTAAVSSYLQAMSLPYSKTQIAGQASGQSLIKGIKNYMSTKRIFGVKSIDQEVAYTGDASSSPANQWVWILYVSTVGESGTATMQGVVRITYYVEFYNRKQIAIS